MELKGFTAKLYRLCEWVFWLAYVNILWILFSLVGLVIFGIFPATSAMFSVVRSWKLQGTDIPIFKIYWKSYRTDFLKANIIGFILVMIGFMLFINYKFLIEISGWQKLLMVVVFINVLIFYIVLLLFIFPTLAHYRLTVFNYLKYALIIGATHPLSVLLLIVIIIPVVYIMFKFPSLLLFFSGIFISYIIMSIVLRCIKDVENKNQENERIQPNIAVK